MERTEPDALRTGGPVRRDLLWAGIWLCGILALVVWDVIFLNRPAFILVAKGFFHTLVIAACVSVFSLVMAWPVTLALHFMQSGTKKGLYFIITFVLNLIRSLPQIVGVLLGYILVVYALNSHLFPSMVLVFPTMASIMSVFIFIEIVDLMRERIAYYQELDFYNAMLVCGIPESRIINFDILWKNSRAHIFNKLISVFSMAVFLQCSVDFIISVGLSQQISAVDLPVTLGNLLANIDSKQDVLAIGYTLTHPFYLGNLFFKHLQGISVSFLIVFTLLSLHQISSGFSERHKL